MSRTAKIWLITAAFLILVGCIIFLGVMTALKWDFMRLSTVEHQTVSYDISEEYGNIAVVSKTADIAIVPSENGNTSVVCYEDVKVSHSVSVKDGTLFIEVVDTRNWYEYIGVNFNTRRVTVYVPKGYNGALSIDTSTGNVDISRELSFESVGIAASTADIESYAPKGVSEIVSGGAKGVDSLAKEYSERNRLKLTEFFPEYIKYGKAAPIVRNKKIAEYADEALVFWDGSSKGTEFSIKYFEKLGKKARVIIVKK